MLFMADARKKKKNLREFLVYLVCGVLTTVVNVGVYHVLFRAGVGVTTSGVISVICAKIFAYVSNKLWVFASHCKDNKELGFEIGRFAIVRGLSGVVDVALTTLLAYVIPKDFDLAFALGGCSFSFVILDPGVAAKYITQPVVIVLNYVLGKKFVFKGTAEEEAAPEASESAEESGGEAGEGLDSEARPFHTVLMMTQDFCQDKFAALYSFLFSSQDEDESEGERVSMSERFFAFLAFFRITDIADWCASLFRRKNEGDAYYNDREDAYVSPLPQNEEGAGSPSRGFRIGGSRLFIRISAKVIAVLIIVAAVFCLWKVSRSVYSNFSMDQGHVFRQAHMFESLKDVFLSESADRSGAVFTMLQIVYARLCAKLNYALLVTPTQYCLMSFAISACCLVVLALIQGLVGILSASTAVTVGLVFFLAGKNILQLDGGLFVLQLTILLLILTSYCAALKSYQSGYKYYLFRCLLISLLAGFPGAMPSFAFLCLVLIFLTQSIGIIWNARQKTVGSFAVLAISRLLPLLLPIAAIYFFCGTLDPTKFEVNGNFWIASSPNPAMVTPWLNNTEYLCGLSVLLGALLMWLTDLKRCGLYGILSSVFFYFYLRVTELNPGTAGYASAVFLAAIIGQGGILIGRLATLMARAFSRFAGNPRLRPLAAVIIVLPLVIFLFGYKRSSYELESSDLSDVMEKVCQILDNQGSGFRTGDIIILPGVGKGEEGRLGSSSLYDVLRYEQRRKLSRKWTFLENNDYLSADDHFLGETGYAWWFISTIGRPDFRSVSDICTVMALNDTTALLKSVEKIHSPQQLAAMTLALAECARAPWSADALYEISTQLLYLPPLSLDDYTVISVRKAYRKWIVKGLEGASVDELKKSRNSIGRLFYCTKTRDTGGVKRMFELLREETPDPWLLFDVYYKARGDISFMSPSLFKKQYGFADENFRAFTETFDKIYLHRPENVAFVREWEEYKRAMSQRNDLPATESAQKEMGGIITNSLPRHAVLFFEDFEQLMNGYFIKGLGDWRAESESEEKLPTTFLSTPGYKLSEQGEPGGKAGATVRMLLPPGVYAASAYARIPEGREAPSEVSMRFRQRGIPEVRAKKWRTLCGQWTQEYMIITNSAENLSFFCLGSENVASPGAVEFTDVSFRRIDGDFSEKWKRDPLNWVIRREKDEAALRLEEKERQHAWENELSEGNREPRQGGPGGGG